MKLSLRTCVPSVLLTLAACDPAAVDEEAGGGLDEGPDELASRPDHAGAAADCCAASSSPGCSDVAVEACVCDVDPYCCATAWDSLCVGEVESAGCGTCSSAAECCSATSTPGCAVPSVHSCVCAEDPYCCATAWDSLCVDEVDSLGCGTCEAIDLLVSDIEVPLVACPGEEIGSSTLLEVTNGGSADVTEFFHVGWYLSNDDTLDAGDTLLPGGRDQIFTLAGGASTSLDLGAHNEIPAGAAPGSRFIIVSVDEFDSHAESDELNNIVAMPITIEPECTGASEWARGIGGTQAEILETGSAVAVDGDGNTYVLLTYYSPSITIEGATFTLTGSSDALLSSYDADGVHRWSKKLGGSAFDVGRGIGVDGAGNVYVAGETEGTLNLGGGALAPIGAARNIWIASYDTGGAHRWSKRHGGSSTVLLRDVAVSDDGRVIVAGHMNGTINVGGAALTSAGAADMLVFALDSGGAHLWSRRLGGVTDDHAHGVAIDDDVGVMVSGYFTGTANFGSGALVSAGSADGVVISLDPTSATRWARRWGNSAIDIAEDVVLDGAGNSYMIGTFGGTIDLGGGPLVAGGTYDAVVASYNANGGHRWSRRVGSEALDYGRGIALDVGGEPVVTGSFFGVAADLGAPHAGVGGYDTFFAGYSAAAGAHRWSDTLGTAANEEGWDVAVSPTGTVVLTGTFASTLTVAGTALATAGSNDVFVASVLP